MPKLILFRFILAACFAIVMAWPQANAQFGNTYYHMFGVPQANQLNPAFQPGCNGYVSMPFAGRIRFAVESNSVTYGDIFEWNSADKKYISFLHPDGNKQKFMDALKPVNLIRAEAGTSLISAGWRKEQMFFTFSFSEHYLQGFSFSKDMAEFMVYGNLYNDNFNFSDLGVNMSFYHQLAFGASYNLDDEMWFGVRAKLLLGGVNSTTRSSDIFLKTSTDEWQVKSDVLVEASIPYLDDLPVDDEGYLDFDSLGNADFDLLFGFPAGIPDLLTPSGLSVLAGTKNPGFAIDLGFNYVPIEKLNVSASVVDLGFIRWKNYVYNFQQNLDYTFQGIELKLDEDYSPGEGLLDSLQNDMRVKVTKEPYTTMLRGKVYLGVAYDLTERVRFGGVFRTRIYNYKFYNQYTISANVQPISMFSASLSYSIYNNSYMNLGLGLSMRAGPLNLYFITDQAPSAYFWPQEFTSLNFRFGLNIVWGCSKIPKGMKDRPLID